MSAKTIDAALAYHERTKHHLPNRFAASLGYLDWKEKPIPFRIYEGADKVALARPTPSDEPALDDVYDPTRIESRPIDHGAISQLMFDALALSAWKQAGRERWPLRCNPSSGNLHPTEAYLGVAAIDGICDEPALLHYCSLLHALEQRAVLGEAAWQRLALPSESFVIGLTSIHWREAWKYGERAYRYCQLDVGHAIAAISYAAATIGWHLRLLDGVGDDELEKLLGVQDQLGPEAEHGDCLMLVSRAPIDAEAAAGIVLPEAIFAADWAGTANRLSKEPREWPAIDAVASACRRPQRSVPAVAEGASRGEPPRRAVPARPTYRARRSAVDMDGETSMPAADFFRLLARLMPHPQRIPFAPFAGPARIHPVFFVHRVEGLAAGLYVLGRDDRRLGVLREALSSDLDQKRVDTGVLALPLYRLQEGDCQRTARTLCCHQDIASDGAFAVAMLAELEPTLQEQGAWMYRRLHWEAGVLGQLLYLEAEACGLRGTGIGCFFDDGVHELLGLRGRRLQTIYHFTIGAAVEDPRLQTLDAYHHLEDRDRSAEGGQGA